MKLFYEKYIKLAHIGKGANAHVYKVRHAELGYVRAIKVLTDYIENKNDRTYLSFLKECKTLLAIGNGAHPNIVRIYGPDLVDNRAIVEMDYVQGVTLDSYIKENGFLEYDEVRTFIHDIVGALAYTHHDIYKFLMNPEEDGIDIDPNDGRKFIISDEKEAELVKKYGIAHNDLHSNNVMRRDYDGRFVLLDFGLAVQDGRCIKSSRMGDGNPEYQAPEKFDSENVDMRSDVYSLGVLIYELLTGRVPFQLKYDEDGKVTHREIHRILNRHQTETPPPILPLRQAAFERQYPGAAYERDYPEWLDNVVMMCLAKNPEDRYRDAKELYDVISEYLKKESSHISESNILTNEDSSNSANEHPDREELEYYKALLMRTKEDLNKSENKNELLHKEIQNLIKQCARSNYKKRWILPSVLLILLIGMCFAYNESHQACKYYTGAYFKLQDRLKEKYGDTLYVDKAFNLVHDVFIDGKLVHQSVDSPSSYYYEND